MEKPYFYDDDEPIFSLTNPTKGQEEQQVKMNPAVVYKRWDAQARKEERDRHWKAIHDTKVWLGLVSPDKRQQEKRNKKGRKNKQWQQKGLKSTVWQLNSLQRKRWQTKKVDRFANQKRWLKEWNKESRFISTNYMDYLTPSKDKRYWDVKKPISQGAYFKNLQHVLQQKVITSVKINGISNLKLRKSTALTAAILNQRIVTKLHGNYSLKKQMLTVYDKVFYYYTLQTPLNMYAHKAFILLEMQLNATLVRAKLVPYLFLVRDLCFYRLIQINAGLAKNPYQVVSLYDSISIPVYLHNYMYYRQYRIHYYPKNIGGFFKNYWAHFTNYTNNKVWLLSNFITSEITAEVILFDYPNISLYMGPFKRFTKMYYKNHPYAPVGSYSYLNHTHTVLKLKLFEYATFYK